MNALSTHRYPDWNVLGKDWPNRENSRFVRSGPLTWHVQVAGSGPALLLIHGTGAASHSFRRMLPDLARDFTVIVPDLPGHGFTRGASQHDLTLSGMARALAALIAELKLSIVCAAGHSAGAAILLRMALDGRLPQCKLIVGFNAAIRPIAGSGIYGPLARLLFINPLAPKLFAWRAESMDATRRLLAGTGSTIEPEGVALYRALFRHSGHVAGTLGMMANWDLESLNTDLGKLKTTTMLVATRGDKAVPFADSQSVAALSPAITTLILNEGGHLYHEEQPNEAARLLRLLASDAAIAPGATRTGEPEPSEDR
ncbi:alpha/beta fold hydrolase BchO [Rhizobium sp. EC-SD404]|uniref:alpha/beta fold hydrolase BchO n=1 Tax=Rhizobium sp. EC-SD404 TaxID=2038389 RepID=UPI0012518392|nr:alpha/beta fold hydrolase BchO [Rhizobium sp. EC-SD404]VVT04234.1 Magnesium-chelatase 30 kDa subunit [Rhizobium sp. EC-SD404]